MVTQKQLSMCLDLGSSYFVRVAWRLLLVSLVGAGIFPCSLSSLILLTSVGNVSSGLVRHIVYGLQTWFWNRENFPILGSWEAEFNWEMGSCCVLARGKSLLVWMEYREHSFLHSWFSSLLSSPPVFLHFMPSFLLFRCRVHSVYTSLQLSYSNSPWPITSLGFTPFLSYMNSYSTHVWKD